MKTNTKKADSQSLIADRPEAPVTPEVAAKCYAASIETAERFERAAETARSLRRSKAALEATMMAQEHRRRAEYYMRFIGACNEAAALAPGVRVNVYQKPITQEKYEGVATIVRQNNEPDFFEGTVFVQCEVRFRDGTFSRLVSPRDIVPSMEVAA